MLRLQRSSKNAIEVGHTEMSLIYVLVSTCVQSIDHRLRLSSRLEFWTHFMGRFNAPQFMRHLMMQFERARIWRAIVPRVRCLCLRYPKNCLQILRHRLRQKMLLILLPHSLRHRLYNFEKRKHGIG